MAIAGGVLLSSVVSFYFTPPMFVLLRRRNSVSQHKLGQQSANVRLPQRASP
jgi:multidrug efflux pump subunit AcrB